MKENDIRPKELFDEYLKLSENDVKANFKKVDYRFIPCPACDCDNTSFVFVKNGLNYELCDNCKTIFLNPRPDKDAFEKYCQDGSFVKFWATRMYKETEDVRRKNIIRPRALQVKDKIEKFANINRIGWIADIGAGYGTFCEEISKVMPSNIKVCAIEPSEDFAEICQKKGLTVVRKKLEDVTISDIFTDDSSLNGVLTSFDVLEHLCDPEEFLIACWHLLKRDGLLIFTMPSSTGFDVQVLWENSKNLAPPHHINFFNPASIKILFKKCGFEVCEVTTPGKLDINIVENNIDYVTDRFVRIFLQMADQSAKDEFQEFLQKHNLSSHMMVVAKKVERKEPRK
jgi:SAM-dependent methyltransferase